MQKKNIISAILVALVLLAGLAYWAYQRGVIYFADGAPRFSVSAITNPVPDLDRPVNYPADFPEAGKEIYERDIAGLRERIEADAEDYEAWLDLAIYYRMVGDHAGAVDIWEYLIKKYPSDSISLHNLGEYYFRVEKDYPRAEEYYNRSIAANATLQSNYSDLYDMYRYAYKTDTDLAIESLERGITGIVGPERIELKIVLGRHYRDILGDTENARKYLTEARDDARTVGDESIANALQQELNAL